ncbi:MAG: NAD(P)-dependent oxidoreductase [Bacillota bacterium]|nr:NAD(P)-dependent oxidoreductase [Bacillota bacterium]
MFEMKNTLEELEKINKPIQVAVVGIGKMGRSLVDRLLAMKGIRPALIVNRHIEKAYEALLYLGIAEDQIVKVFSADQVEAALKDGKFAVTDDFSVAIKSPSIQALVEATGNPQYGAEVAYQTIKAKKHIIMLNVECDSVVGPSLYKLAQENGVVYTGAAGDEPAAIIELVEYAMGLGFEVVACGKGKNNPKDIHATNDSVRALAAEKQVCEKSLTSFVDATNTMIELNAVGNAIGFKPDVFGCHGITADIKDLGDKLRLKEEGGLLNSFKTLDYVHGIAPGVYVVIRAKSQEEKDTLKYLGMGHGPNYILYRPFHLCSLETPNSIYKAVVKNQASLAPVMGQVCDTVAHAKRDMKAGELLHGIGSDYVYGSLTSHQDAMDRNLLPIALITSGTRLKVDVKKDQLISYDMVDLEMDQIITKLRFEQDGKSVQE